MRQTKTQAMDNATHHPKYLRASYFCDYIDPQIARKVQELTEGIPADDPGRQAVSLFYFVRDQIKYVAYGDRDYLSRKNMKASATLQRGHGYCIQKAVLLAALARAKGIPARVHFVDIMNYLTPQRFIEMMGRDLFIYHGFAELWLNGKWIEANVAFDKELCLKKGYPIGEFDGKTPCLFSHNDAKGHKFVEYIKDRKSWAEVPYYRILLTWLWEYGVKGAWNKKKNNNKNKNKKKKKQDTTNAK